MQNRDSLIYTLAERVAYNMDGDSLMSYAIEKLREEYEQYPPSDEQLLAELSEYCPDLLDLLGE
jgi:hypothetical protein